MTQGLATPMLAACLGARSREPRSPDDFIAHPDEAAGPGADCRRSSHRGQECVNAAAGDAPSAERMKPYGKSF